jgi:hypothetical protein
MYAPYTLVEACDEDAAKYAVYEEATVHGCLKVLRSHTTGVAIPTTVLMKDTNNNIEAYPFLLSTIPVNGAKVRVFELQGNGFSVHNSMGLSGMVADALKSAGSNRGGLQFSR